MTAETRNNVDKNDVNKHETSTLNGDTRAWAYSGKISIPVMTGLLLFVVLSLVILSVNDEPVDIGQNPDNDEAPAITLSETPNAPQSFSPQALEDLRTAPTGDLEIQPEPILPPLLPEQSAELSSDEEPILAGREPVLQEGVQEPGGDDFSVGEALARYVIAMQDDLNREYVENCIQFRTRNGLDEGCPENPAITAGANQKEKALVEDLFAIITRQSEYARISRQLERENEALTAILTDPDNRAAAQASTKLALNNSYLEYLNGNRSPAVVMSERMNDFINDYNRTIMSGPVQFRCKDGPCIYEYTGPEAE